MSQSTTENKDHPVIASVYSALSQHSDSHFFCEMRSDLLHGQCGRILDIGAGSSANIPYLELTAKLTLSKPDNSMLKHSREAFQRSERNFELVQSQAESLPFGNGSFGIVLATLVFCSIDQPALALSEIRRILKPKGQLIFLEHIATSQPRRFRPQNFITPLWNQIAGVVAI